MSRRFLVYRRWPLGVVLLGALLGVALLTQNPYYMRLFIWYGAIYALIVAGLNVLTGATGQVSLGHVALFAIGAYVSGWLGVAKLPWAICALAAVACAAAGGLLIGAPALRLKGAYLALATLAFALVVLQLLEALPKALDIPGGDAAVLGVPRPAFGSLVPRTEAQYYVFAVLVAAPFVWVSRNVFWSATGRQLQAVRDDEYAARALGISVYPAKLSAFVFSAACAGLAGALFASMNGNVFRNDFTQVDSLRYVVALLIGGLAAPVAGPVWGALATVGLTYVGQTYFQDKQALLTAVVFLGVLALFPRGIGGLLRRTPLARWLPGPGPTLVAAGVLRRGGTLADVERLAHSDAGADAAAAAALAGPPPPSPPSGAALPAGPLFGVPPRKPDDTGRPVPAWGPVALDDRPALLDVTQVSKRFGGVQAVDGVSFTVRAGSIHVLMGPNGSGKSTVLDLVTGLTRTDSGRVNLASRDITGLAAHRRARAGIARTFQEIRLFGSLTALENCMVGVPTRHRVLTQVLRVPGARDEDARHAAEALDILEAWGLGEFAGRPASALSYGQRKMLELARAASRHPQILLVDEPSAGLNPRWVAAMVDALSGLRDAGLTLLVVEHHQDVIADLADTVTVLDQGRVIAEGPPAYVQRLPTVLDVYLGTPIGVAP